MKSNAYILPFSSWCGSRPPSNLHPTANAVYGSRPEGWGRAGVGAVGAPRTEAVVPNCQEVSGRLYWALSPKIEISKPTPLDIA